MRCRGRRAPATGAGGLAWDGWGRRRWLVRSECREQRLAARPQRHQLLVEQPQLTGHLADQPDAAGRALRRSRDERRAATWTSERRHVTTIGPRGCREHESDY